MLTTPPHLPQDDSGGRSALFHAVLRGDELAVRELVENGASVNLADFSETTPLQVRLDGGIGWDGWDGMGSDGRDGKGWGCKERDGTGRGCRGDVSGSLTGSLVDAAGALAGKRRRMTLSDLPPTGERQKYCARAERGRGRGVSQPTSHPLQPAARDLRHFRPPHDAEAACDTVSG